VNSKAHNKVCCSFLRFVESFVLSCARIRMLNKRTIKQLTLPRSEIPGAYTNTSNYWLVHIPQRYLNNKQLKFLTIKLYQDYSSRLTQKKKTQTWFLRCQRKGESGYTPWEIHNEKVVGMHEDRLSRGALKGPW